ncbi:MAG: SDR family oxidoreductase [Actinobacteria bacterium]|nr:SDR family oxidoreductase [Actinomycetota bacterium]MCA1721637.1 SDR family oxidoreductase [Actinomycetota bacterium]
MSTPLAGRTALITGVSRRRGIGFAVASRLASMGASLAVHHYAPHDVAEYGASDDLDALLAELRAALRDEASLAEVSGDLGDPRVARGLLASVGARMGHVDVLICNHAHGGDAVGLSGLTAEALDRHWAVNTRATLLLTQAFAAQHDGRRGGRVIWMTSGQALGPMSDNLAYAASKAALAGATWSVADDLLGQGILLNTINPGPVNTGYLDEAPQALLDRFPQHRVGEPDDPARLIAWLVSDDGEWVSGQVLNSEGGFRR